MPKLNEQRIKYLDLLDKYFVTGKIEHRDNKFFLTPMHKPDQPPKTIEVNSEWVNVLVSDFLRRYFYNPHTNKWEYCGDGNLLQDDVNKEWKLLVSYGRNK